MALSGSVFEIWHVTDRQTDRHPHRFMIWPHVVGHIINGACNLVEHQLGRNVLHLASCIHEIMFEEVFSTTMGPSSGPEIQLFKCFKVFWPNVVFTDYWGSSCCTCHCWCVGRDQGIYHQSASVSSSAWGLLRATGTRINISWRCPMSRSTFQKVWCHSSCTFHGPADLLSGFKMTAREHATSGLGSCLDFQLQHQSVTYICLNSWRSADHQHHFVHWRSCVVNFGISAKSWWHLFFSMEMLMQPRKDLCWKHFNVKIQRIHQTDQSELQLTKSSISNKRLHDFVMQNTMNFFRILSDDPETWVSNDSYLEAEAVVRELSVVNDTANAGSPWCKIIILCWRKTRIRSNSPSKSWKNIAASSLTRRNQLLCTDLRSQTLASCSDIIQLFCVIVEISEQLAEKIYDVFLCWN